MTPQPNDDHTLNACLARVIGMALVPSARNDYWLVVDDDENELVEWDPLHDANQMEEVEAFIQSQHKIEYVWTGEYWYVTLDRWCLVSHRDKKRAFALAVQAMEQARKDK